MLLLLLKVVSKGGAGPPLSLSKERRRRRERPHHQKPSPSFFFSVVEKSRFLSFSLSSTPSLLLLSDGVEVLGRLPREDVGRLAAEVAVGRRLQVARLGQVERARDQSGPEVEGLEHLGEDLLVRDLARAVRVDVHRQRLRDADGVRDLHERAAGEPGRDDRLGGLARDVGAGAVDLGRVLAGEGAAAVGSPA